MEALNLLNVLSNFTQHPEQINFVNQRKSEPRLKAEVTGDHFGASSVSQVISQAPLLQCSMREKKSLDEKIPDPLKPLPANSER